MEERRMSKDTLEEVVRQGLAAETAGLAAALAGFVRELKDGGNPVAAEEALRGNLLAFGARLVERAVEHADPELREGVRKRGHRDGTGGRCTGALHSKGLKETDLLSLLGPLRLPRWTAQCRSCGKWVGSIEEALGAENGMTAACASAVAAAAVTLPYAQAQAQLLRMVGVRVDDNRILRTVATLGPRAEKIAARDPKKAIPRGEAPPRKGWVYLFVDGGRIRMREGAAWREPCTAIVAWRDAKGRWRKFGVSDVHDKARVMEVLSRWVDYFRTQGYRHVAVIADGAEWIWEWAYAQRGVQVRILDYYHMKEHVWKAANALFGEGKPEAACWVEKIVGWIWRGWTLKTIERLERMKPRDPVAREAVRALVTYLRNHAGQMDYARFRADGCLIGSGMIESFCKQLFSMRMKGAGMFWSEEGAQHLMSLRTLYLTDRWDTLWTPAAA